ncbi:MAG: hypothetical protein ND807_11480 [Vicinamibacterales bacterium]|nr:hypothetical protein [Vicinamibacterales bacterium]
MLVRTRGAALLFVMLAAPAAGGLARAQSQAAPLSPADVLNRLGTYLNTYSDQLSRAVANERYKQGSRSGRDYNEATLESEFGIIKVPDYEGWLGFRDVLRVNGKVVQDHETRLQELLLRPSRAALEQARRIAEESARHNIGAIKRTINNPALVLELFDRRNQDRMRFSKADEDTIDLRHVWVLRFEEVKKPTLIQTPQGRDVPTDGQIWVDPVDGVLARAEVNIKGFFVAGGFGQSKAQMRVYFKEDPRLKLWVPVRLTENYLVAGLGEITGEATYSNYRQFGTSTQEQFNEIP